MSFIRHHVVWAVVAACTAGVAQAESDMQGPEKAVISLDNPRGMGVGVRFQWDQRHLDVEELSTVEGAADPDMDLFRVLTRLGGNPVPFLHLYGDAGWSVAQFSFDDDAEGDFTWGIGAQAILLEHVIASSPVVGKLQSLDFAVEAQFRQVASSLRTGDLEYDELLVMPSLRYSRNARGQRHWHPYHPTGLSGELGLAFSSIDGELGPLNIEGHNTTGLFLGATFRKWRNWVTDIDLLLFGNGDFSLSAGAIYDF